jgi:hypothetical protein
LPVRIAVLIGALALVAAAVGASAQPASIVVEDWSRQTVGKTGVPDGWKPQNWGSPKYDFRIVAEGNAKVLHMKSDNEGSTINKEVKIDLRAHPVVEWRWKAVMLPKGADSRKKETDDQAAQLHRVPALPHRGAPRIIGYVWEPTPRGPDHQEREDGDGHLRHRPLRAG